MPPRSQTSTPESEALPGKDADIVIWDVEPLDTMYQAGIVLIDGKIAYERKAGERNVDYQKL